MTTLTLRRIMNGFTVETAGENGDELTYVYNDFGDLVRGVRHYLQVKPGDLLSPDGVDWRERHQSARDELGEVRRELGKKAERVAALERDLSSAVGTNTRIYAELDGIMKQQAAVREARNTKSAANKRRVMAKAKGKRR